MFELLDLVESHGVGIQIISNGGLVDDALVARLAPRERFVPLLALPAAHRDRARPLDDEGRASISAMHAYLATFRPRGR